MRVAGHMHGAGEMNRTPDLLITNELLYRLSYTGLDELIITSGSDLIEVSGGLFHWVPLSQKIRLGSKYGQ